MKPWNRPKVERRRRRMMQVLTLYQEGKSSTEISQELDTPLGTIRYDIFSLREEGLLPPFTRKRTMYEPKIKEMALAGYTTTQTFEALKRRDPYHFPTHQSVIRTYGLIQAEEGLTLNMKVKQRLLVPVDGHKLVLSIKGEAHRRRTTPEQLVANAISAVVEDNLWSALLDDE